MTDKRYAEIAADKKTCEFCSDLGNDDICVKCQKVQPIAFAELKEFWTMACVDAPQATTGDDWARQPVGYELMAWRELGESPKAVADTLSGFMEEMTRLRAQLAAHEHRAVISKAMERLTVDPKISFCDTAQCRELPGGTHCPDGPCDQRRCYERLREYERTVVSPEEVAKAAHARWVAELERTGNYAHCSACGYRCQGYVPNYKHCPECGAKMKGVLQNASTKAHSRRHGHSGRAREILR